MERGVDRGLNRIMMLETILQRLLLRLGFVIRRRSTTLTSIPDANFYELYVSPPYFSPWLGYGEFKHFFERARPFTVVSADRCYVLYTLASQALRLNGEFWECGVYKGGTAMLLAELVGQEKANHHAVKLHLFDTFGGMPDTDPQRDLHQRGDFSDTSLEAVKRRVGGEEIAVFHKGLIPDTFNGMEASKISFAHIDVDIYQSIMDCCSFIYPRLIPGGFVVFDDYGHPSCPGARQAVDAFFEDKPERPLVLPTGQAVIFAIGAA